MNNFLDNLKKSVTNYFNKEKFESLITNNDWIFKKYKNEYVEFNNTRLLFNSDKTLITSNQKEVLEANWKYLNDHNELYINFEEFKLLLKPVYISEALIIFETHIKNDYFLFYNPKLINSEFSFLQNTDLQTLTHFENGLVIQLKNNLKLIVTQSIKKNINIEELRSEPCIIMDNQNNILTDYQSYHVSQKGKYTFEIVDDLIIDVHKNKLLYIQNDEYQVIGVNEYYSKTDLIEKYISKGGLKVNSKKIKDNNTTYYIENSKITKIVLSNNINLVNVGEVKLLTEYHKDFEEVYAIDTKEKLNGKFKNPDTGYIYYFNENNLKNLVKKSNNKSIIIIIIMIVLFFVYLLILFNSK